MQNILINERDQKFLLYEMLGGETIINNRQISRRDFDMTLKAARELAVKEVYPALQKGDRQGCRFENGNVYAPKSFHRLKRLFDEGGWSSLRLPREYGGQGFSLLMYFAATEYFMHNTAINVYTTRSFSNAKLIAAYGSHEQKLRYLKHLSSGRWGGPFALTEPDAGCDIGAIATKAERQSDGSYRISGTKCMVSNGDSDLFSNMLFAVVARVEGAPAGIEGLSVFLVPKYTPNPDGSRTNRNDYVIDGLEDKMGRHGWATCSTVHFGENGRCCGELLGRENMGLFMIFELLTSLQLCIGLSSSGVASAAYLHALKYAAERIQGSHFSNAMNPTAPKVAIIEHPDVRRTLLWMKAQVEGMRALVYYCGELSDRIETTDDTDQQAKLKGLLGLLTPVCRVYCSDTAFKVTEQALQVFGGNGYFKDFPMEQFMRDVKAESLYEGPNGLQAFQLVASGIGPEGKHLIRLLTEIKMGVARYQNIEDISDLAQDLTARIAHIEELGVFLNTCAAEGRLIVPITHAYPILNMIGIVTLGWLLFRQAGIAARRLADLIERKGIDLSKEDSQTAFIRRNADAAYFDGKLKAARYFIKHCLPQADALFTAITSNDLSAMEICDESF